MWNRFYRRYGDLAEEANFERCLAAMLSHRAIRELGAKAGDVRRQFRQGPATYGRLFAIFHEHYARRQGKGRWGDQLGFAERFAGPIFAAFPDGKMIHMMRDPRDTIEVAMQLARFRQGKVGWSMARWLYSAELAKENQARYPDGYCVVHYEQLMAEPERMLRQLCDFLEEQFQPPMLETLLKAGPGPNGDAQGFRKPVRRPEMNNAGAGRRMSGRELAFAQSYTGSYLEAFGYPIRSTRFSALDHFLFYLVDWPTNRAAMVTWQALKATSLSAQL
jgi:hypothetical protein